MQEIVSECFSLSHQHFSQPFSEKTIVLIIFWFVCFGTALEGKILDQICEQEDTIGFLPNSVFPPVKIHPEAPENIFSEEFFEEENIQVLLLLSNV